MSTDPAFDRLAEPQSPEPGPNLGSLHLLRSGWRIFRARPWLVALGMLLMVAVFLFLDHIIGKIMPMPATLEGVDPMPAFPGPGAFAILLALQIVLGFMTLGYCFMLLRIRRGQGGFGDIFAPFSRFFPMVLLAILSWLICTAGTLLFVIPGIIASLGLCYAPFILLESPLGPVASLRASWRLTRGYKWRIFLFGLATLLFMLLCCLIEFLPIIALGVLDLPPWTMLVGGLLITVPVMLLSFIIAAGGWMSAYDELIFHYERTQGAAATPAQV